MCQSVPSDNTNCLSSESGGGRCGDDDPLFLLLCRTLSSSPEDAGGTSASLIDTGYV